MFAEIDVVIGSIGSVDCYFAVKGRLKGEFAVIAE